MLRKILTNKKRANVKGPDDNIEEEAAINLTLEEGKEKYKTKSTEDDNYDERDENDDGDDNGDTENSDNKPEKNKKTGNK